MNKDAQISNIKKGLQAGLDKLIVACKSKALMEALKKKTKDELGEEILKEIEFREVEEFYEPPGRK